MTIYIVERINPECFEEPQVFLNGREAVMTIRKEYEEEKEFLEIDSVSLEDEYDYEWDYDIDENNFCGGCYIEEVDGDDRWQWRLTSHNILE